eukprot:8011756-Pyramimonas_sp.AAC.1
MPYGKVAQTPDTANRTDTSTQHLDQATKRCATSHTSSLDKCRFIHMRAAQRVGAYPLTASKVSSVTGLPCSDNVCAHPIQRRPRQRYYCHAFQSTNPRPELPTTTRIDGSTIVVVTTVVILIVLSIMTLSQHESIIRRNSIDIG